MDTIQFLSLDTDVVRSDVSPVRWDRVRSDRDWWGTYVAVVTSDKEVRHESVTTCARCDADPWSRSAVAASGTALAVHARAVRHH